MTEDNRPTSTVGYEAIVALAASIIEERGRDYVYERQEGSGICTYWHSGNGEPWHNRDHTAIATGRPGCIVGHILHRLGASPEGIASLDGQGSVGYIATTHGAPSLVEERIGVRFTDKAVDFLREVQSRQDKGATWGEAFEYGKGYIRGVRRGTSASQHEEWDQ